MNKQLLERITNCHDLPTLPAVAVEVLQLSQSEDLDLTHLANAISRDPALASRMLRTVNSAFYGHHNAIVTLRGACVFLGLQSVKNLVLGFSLVRCLSERQPGGFDHILYWRRALYSAMAARLLAEKTAVADADTCFIGGLLMDLGMLALDQVVGGEYGLMCTRAANHQDLLDRELKLLDLTHADAIEALAGHWSLPERLCIPMAHHHRPGDLRLGMHRSVAEILFLAGQCAGIFVDQRPAMSIAQVRRQAMERFGIGELECDAMLCRISQRTRELAPLFEIAMEAGESYETILENSNEELLRLTIEGLDEKKGIDRRRYPRIRRENVLRILPCGNGIIHDGITMRLTDVSSHGVGLRHAERLEPGQQFIVQLRQKEGTTVSVLYRVVRCIAGNGAEQHFIIGAEFMSILARPAADTQPARASGPEARIQRAVMARSA